MSRPLDRLKHHVSGAIERGEKEPIVSQPRSKHTRDQLIKMARLHYGAEVRDNSPDDLASIGADLEAEGCELSDYEETTPRHTPGPWEMTANYHQNPYIYGADESPICKVLPGPNNTPNAHLIAACPEMYEQLKLVQAYFKEKGMVWIGIDEALNKAEGKDS